MAKERILLVEDNAMNRRVAEFLLKSQGYLVYEARDGQEALDLARAHLPDLILMDLQLPGLDGFAATRLIKQDAATRTIPVVALTAYAMTGDAERASDAGCDGYITKPINPDDFTGIVAGYLQRPSVAATGTEKDFKPGPAKHDAPRVDEARAGTNIQDPRALPAIQPELLWKARIDAIGDVAAALGHEVANLLGAVATCVQILRRNPQINEEDAELLDIIHTGSRRLNQKIAELSIFRSGALRLQEVNVHELIGETLAALQRDQSYADSRIDIRRNFDSSVRQIKADRDQLAHALRNIFVNAFQAMGNGGELTIETRKTGGDVKILVRDSGPGIPTTALPNIFEPFYSARSGGLGLGLAAVRYIVERHMGHVTAQNESGAGACFTLILPVDPNGNNDPERRGA